MATYRIPNGEAADHTSRKEAFLTHNKTLMGSWQNDKLYAVHSYGSHLPIYVYDAEVDRWFGNSGTAPVTTSSHKSQAFPYGVTRDEIVWTDTYSLITMLRAGSYAAYCGRRVAA